MDHISLANPLCESGGFQVGKGFDNIDGAVCTDKGISFTVRCKDAYSCVLHLFCNGVHKEIKFPKECRHNGVFSLFVYNLKPEGISYAYSFTKKTENGSGTLLLDPYAKEVSNTEDIRRKGNRRADMQKTAYFGRIPDESFDWMGTGRLHLRMEDLVIYELHVRGFTMGKDSGVKNPGTYMGVEEKIPYLKELGINAVELMPVFEFDEAGSIRSYGGRQLPDYWGYNTVSFFSPKSGYAASGKCVQELKHLIRSLHKAGIAVILDVVFNHTAEGNENGPVFSFKGINAEESYIFSGGKHCNYSGCGNTVNASSPYMQKFILDCLRYWVKEYHVDGFRFDLASILTRDKNGNPQKDPPVVRAIAQDRELLDTILIAEAWDAGGLYQVGSFPHYGRWSEWNGRYRDDLRKFLKGDAGMCQTAAHRMTGSHDIYDSSHIPSVSYITCHDGFTMYDLYAYNVKHNEMNGWGNTDGDNNGNNWNCGEEGETNRRDVNDLRRRMVKNAFSALFLSRGPVMFFSGDEFCNTQYGNNNAYCQDNQTGWLDWSRKRQYEEIYGFVRHMAKFRSAHPCIRKETEPASCKIPPVSVFSGNLWMQPGMPDSMMLGILYAGKTENGDDDIVLYLMNAYWKTQKLDLPKLPYGLVWKVDTCTYVEYKDGMDVGKAIGYYGGGSIFVPERSAAVLTAIHKDETSL